MYKFPIKSGRLTEVIQKKITYINKNKNNNLFRQYIYIYKIKNIY